MKASSLLLVVVLLAFGGIIVGACSSSGGAKGGAIERKTWEVTAYADASGNLATEPATVPATVVLSGGKVFGNSGCNQYTASYTISGSSLTITDLSSSKAACPPPANDVEAAVLNDLGRTASFSVDGKSATIYDKDGQELLKLVQKA